MKLYSVQAELCALKTVCNGDALSSGYLLSTLTKDHFHHPDIQAAYSRVVKQAKKDGDIPRFGELITDPALSETARSFLEKKGSAITALKKRTKARKLVKTMDDYYKVRVTFNACKETISALQGDSVEPENILDTLATRLAQARRVISIEDSILHIGKGDNARAKFERSLENDKSDIIPTGFKDFDDINGGFKTSSLVVFTANTGGLKSALAKQVGMNMYETGNSVAYVSLEMDEEEVFYRMFSNKSGIHNLRFVKRELTVKEKREALKAYEDFSAKGKKSGKRFSILPVVDEDLGIEGILNTLQPFGHKALIIDYVSLLKDADSEEQWKALSAVARRCKMYAKKTKTLVIILAQLSDDDKIRYSKGILEHANNWWRWRITDETRESGIFTVYQGKARNQQPFPFELAVDFPTFKITSPSDVILKQGKAKSLDDDDDNGTRTRKFKVTKDKQDSKDGKARKGFQEIGEDTSYYED